MYPLWQRSSSELRSDKFYLGLALANNIALYIDEEYYLWQMHVLAYSYHWSPTELWNMGIAERLKWIKQVQKQNDAEREAMEQK